MPTAGPILRQATAICEMCSSATPEKMLFLVLHLEANCSESSGTMHVPPVAQPTAHPACSPAQSAMCAHLLCPRLSCLLAATAICLVPCLSAYAESAADHEAFSPEAGVEFFQNYCIDCHEGDAGEGGLDLSSFESSKQIPLEIEKWNRIADRVAEQQMPPIDSDTPPMELRDAVVQWIRGTIHAAVCDDGVTPGRPMLRRLNRTEYANTIRDLLGIQFNAGHGLPEDGAGGEGFDNAAETLFISPIHAEKYLDAARAALTHAMSDPQDRKTILVAQPSAETTPQAAAEKVLENFLPRAFRRPVTSDEIQQYVELFQSAYVDDQSYELAIQFAIEAALVSPKFLFLWEQPHTGPEPILISHYEMASRLSYFLWASMPDAELTRLASQGKLHDEEVLAEQVARMVKSRIDDRGHRRDAKVRAFAESFVEQWLGTRAMGREFKPNEAVVGKLDSELLGGMQYEPVFFMEDLLADNRSLLNWIDSDFTYANNRLARHYKIEGTFREQPRRVDLPAGSHRGGALGMSAVLAVSSFSHRTSPVLRGKWIMETLLGTAPPPPPPNVPDLDEAGEPSGEKLSLRQRLELHRADPTCASCHAVMDPLGFGLENYDVLGRWRTEVDGIEIDSTGTLPDGTTFAGAAGLKEQLMQRKDAFIRHLTSKMLGYALARQLTNEDQCVVEAISQKLAEDDYRAQTLVLEIIKSVPFQFKSGQLVH
ncbi:Planctomycete cytochrome C [Allorhodopirellula heiligendammensis]|uniref:Planctomycete cytochrome C n=2 Tax=Allorhodopirellula heiligendammensis TaxID=2714739 RepID=A0A5C6BXF0_9BACT|nr:Planctomycete cytochrome C [Allorhodopirellula heiligendammensis]